MRVTERMRRLPPYIFAEIDERKQEALARGVDIIDFGIGDPDLPTPPHIVRRLQKAAENPRYHRYPPYAGIRELRQTAADYYHSRFGVSLNPDTEVVVVIGSKEGLTHLIWATVNEGEPVLVPDPGYPVYSSQTLLMNAKPVMMPLLRENAFLPDLSAIDDGTADASPLLIVNYPNNPTGGIANRAFFEEAVAFARKHDMVLCNDFAYGETTFDDYEAPSVLQIDGARDVAVEFYSLSKPFNMTGWRIGFMVGNADVVGQVGKLKSNIDSGQFGAIQEAALEALTNAPENVVAEANAVYERRRDLLVPALRRFGLDVPDLKATFYLWVPVPEGQTSESFVLKLLEQGVIVTPGNAYGPHGEGYVRFSLTVPDRDIERALPRIEVCVRGLE